MIEKLNLANFFFSSELWETFVHRIYTQIFEKPQISTVISVLIEWVFFTNVLFGDSSKI